MKIGLVARIMLAVINEKPTVPAMSATRFDADSCPADKYVKADGTRMNTARKIYEIGLKICLPPRVLSFCNHSAIYAMAKRKYALSDPFPLSICVKRGTRSRVSVDDFSFMRSTGRNRWIMIPPFQVIRHDVQETGGSEGKQTGLLPLESAFTGITSNSQSE